MQGSQTIKSHASLKTESVWFKAKLISQFLTLSFLLSQPFYLPYLHAAPIGGEVVGGTGTISQSDITTTINQSSQNLAVDWQSFDVNTNERVQFIQPNSSSVALNRILGNNGSTIQGQIDANGQVILVNPNGIFFTSTATINVGGLIASSLDMTPSDFMNGNYIFNEVLGADGAIVNSGIINASLGGNVALIGKQVKNEGLITANLGSVVLAAGKQSVLTFDNQGLIGVQVTKEVLQDELGLEEAVINSGDINAAGGRVLLTASTSRDVFSQAVNNGVLGQATSVVVHEDGSFTLGGGADVLNTGLIDVSSEAKSQKTARIVLLGENITSSGSIKADVQNGNAGEIEIHAKNKTLLTENSITSAKALSSGQGGLVKILGDKVGVLDSSILDASGVNGGGEILIGGDQEGSNNNMRNAQFIYLSEQSQVHADATDNGNGGKVIAFAENSAKIHGRLFARGGINGGNGGFIETSGLLGFLLTSVPNTSANVGNNGTWLIDPFDITITDNNSNVVIGSNESFFDATGTGAEIKASDIVKGLKDNSNVYIRTTRQSDTSDGTPESGDILFEADIDFDGIDQSSTLTLDADGDINTNGFDIWDDKTDNKDDLLNIVFNADVDGINGGNVIITDSKIWTNGGSFTARGNDFTLTGNGDDDIDTIDRSDSIDIGDVNLFMSGVVKINTGSEIITRGGNINIGGLDAGPPSVFVQPSSVILDGRLNSTGRRNRNAGEINITTLGKIDVASTGRISANGGTATSDRPGRNGGNITLVAGDEITILSSNSINSRGSNGNHNNASDAGEIGGNGGNVDISTSANNIVISAAINTSGGNGHGDTNHSGAGGNSGSIFIEATNGTVEVGTLTSNGGNANDGGNNADARKGGNANEIRLTSGAGQTITLNNDISASSGSGRLDTDTAGSININGETLVNNPSLSITATGTTNGDVRFNGNVSVAAIRNRDDDLSVTGKDITFAGDVGSLNNRFKDIVIISDGAVKAQTGPTVAERTDFFVDTLNVDQSSSFSARHINAIAVDDTSTSRIDTSNNTVNIKAINSIDVGNVSTTAGGNATGAGLTGGGILLTGQDITVGELNSSGSAAGVVNVNGGAAGIITIAATDNASNGTPSITLNGDLNSEGGAAIGGGTGSAGTSQNVKLSISSTETDAVGTVTVGAFTGNFSSTVDVAGSNGTDTLVASDRTNNWILTGSTTATLNSKLTFTDFEEITGSIALNSDTLTARNVNNTWLVNGAGSGSVTNTDDLNENMVFRNINDLVGDSGVDDFTLTSTGSITGSIDGVSNADNSLTIETSFDNVWAINSENTGAVSLTTKLGNGFSNIQKIKGGDGDDTFNFGINGSVDLVEGGADKSSTPTSTQGDIVNFISKTGGVDVTLGTALTAITTDFNVDSIEQINANATATKNTLTAKNQVNAWELTKTDGGTLDTAGDNRVNFNNFTDLNGALNFDDTFTIGLNGTLQGSIDGRGQSTPSGDVLDLSQRKNIVLTINNTTGHTLNFTGANISYKDIETIKGNNSGVNQSQIVGENKASTWTIDGIDKGSVTENGTSNTVLFENFNFLTGGSLADKFILTGDGAISGVIDGGITSTGDNVTVETPNNMVNLALGSTSVSNATNITNINRIDGDGTNTRIIGENLAQTNWNITSQNIGNVNSSTGQVNFFNVHNLTGNSGKDTFKFDNQLIGVDSLASAVFLAGTIDGGATSVVGFDTVDMSSLVGPFTVKLGVDTNITGTTIVGVETIKGNNLSTLVGDLTARNDLSSTDWTIDSGINDGTVEFINAATENVRVDFFDFINIQGQDNIDDVFTITNGDITGKIKGGGGSGIDSVDYRLSNETEVFVGASSNGVDELEQVIGKSSITLVGAQRDASNNAILNIWIIENDTNNNLTDGDNDGSVTFDLNDGNDSQTLSFVDFGGLKAGLLNDSFTVKDSGSFNGTITGGVGNNSLSVTLSGNQLGKLTFDGVAGINNITIMGDSDGIGGRDYVGEFTANINSSSRDEIKYTNSSDISKVFSIQYENTGTGFIRDNLLATSLTVNGSSSNDIIVLDMDTFKVNAKPAVTYSGKTNFSVNGQGGTADTIRIDSALDFTGGNLTLMAENLATQATVTVFPTITADELTLNSVTNTGTDINKRLNTDITHLSVINSGSLFVQDVSEINIAELNNSNTSYELDIVAAGNITGFDRNAPTTNVDLISNGALTLNATTGSITLAGNNQLSGKLSFTTANTENVRLNNTTSTILDTVTTQNLTVTTSGINSSISQFNNQSVITSDGVTRLSSTGAINLANAANDFTRLAVDSSPSVTIRDANTIGLNLINATLVNITAATNITDANGASNNVNASSLTLTAGTGIGNSTNAIETSVSEINAITTSGGIYIDNIGDVKLTNLVVTNSGNITFNNTGNVEIGRIDAGYGSGTRPSPPVAPAGGGVFTMDVTSGSVTGSARTNYEFVADITAYDANILVQSGTFSTRADGKRGISVKVNNQFNLFSLESAVIYIGDPYEVNDDSTAKIAITDAFSNLAGQQLIEIESIGDVDPAIFTDVRNYNHSDLALMMPSDQRYDISDEEEDEEAKEKREKLINSTP